MCPRRPQAPLRGARPGSPAQALAQAHLPGDPQLGPRPALTAGNEAGTMRRMPEPPKVPMYAARVADLRAGHSVGVICDQCGHAANVSVETVQDRVAGWTFVNKLGLKLRCAKCGERGKVIVNARRALGYA